jgi:hypothetical protein
VEIEVNGPTAVLSMVKTDMGNAALTMSAILAIDMYQGGQNLGGVDRTLHLNGLMEALSDGSATRAGTADLRQLRQPDARRIWARRSRPRWA